MLKSKIHRAKITGADLHYEGSISIDPALLEAANILPHEQVHVLDINNGSRFVTYAIVGKPGEITVNGAAAHLVKPGDLCIVISYAQMTEEEAKKYHPVVIHVDEKNFLKR